MKGPGKNKTGRTRPGNRGRARSTHGPAAINVSTVTPVQKLDIYKDTFHKSYLSGFDEGFNKGLSQGYRQGSEQARMIRREYECGIDELPLVSVLLPIHNDCSPHVTKSLESVIAQTYRRFEVVICDNSTGNGIHDLLLPYLDQYPEIKYFRIDKPAEPLSVLQRCFLEAKGEYIVILHDNEIYLPDKLEKMAPYVANDPDIKIVVSYRNMIGSDGKTVPFLSDGDQRNRMIVFQDGMEWGNKILRTCNSFIGKHCSVLFRKSDMTEPFGTYRGVRYKVLPELASWLHLSVKGKGVELPEMLSALQLQGDSEPWDAFRVVDTIQQWYMLIMTSREAGFLAMPEDCRAALEAYWNQCEAFINVLKSYDREDMLKIPTIQHSLKLLQSELSCTRS